jgi:hypothetical protein
VFAVPESLGVGSPPPDWVPLGEGEPDPDSEGEPEGDPDSGDGDPDSGDGEPDWDEGDPEGDPDWGEGEPDCGDGELDWGGGLPDPVGGGGAWGGWFRKIRMAISTASAASSSMRSHETKIVRHPARS